MNDGWLSSVTRKGASSKTRRRRISRGVSSSERIAKTRSLECAQAVPKLNPADIVTQPGMMRRRESPGCVEAAGGDVDELGAVEMFVGQWRTAGTAELPPHLGRGLVDQRSAACEAEFRFRERH